MAAPLLGVVELSWDRFQVWNIRPLALYRGYLLTPDPMGRGLAVELGPEGAVHLAASVRGLKWSSVQAGAAALRHVGPTSPCVPLRRVGLGAGGCAPGRAGVCHV